jgi:hypothetical protein
MSRLNFSPIDQAFLLGSDQIKDTQEEINNLKKIILNKIPQKDVKKETSTEENTYTRIGKPDKVTATFTESSQQQKQEDTDLTLFKLIRHPRFDEIVKNYVLMYHPEWVLNETNYTSALPGVSKSSFGNNYSTTVLAEMKKYIFFFVICVVIFLTLAVLFREN